VGAVLAPCDWSELRHTVLLQATALSQLSEVVWLGVSVESCSPWETGVDSDERCLLFLSQWPIPGAALAFASLLLARPSQLAARHRLLSLAKMDPVIDPGANLFDWE